MLGLVIRNISEDINESTSIIKKHIWDNFHIKLKYLQYHHDEASDLTKSNALFIHMPYTIKLEITPKYLYTLHNYLGKHKNIIIHLRDETPDQIADFLNAYQDKFNDKSLKQYNIFWEHSVGRKNKYYKFKQIQNLMLTLHSKTDINNNLCLDTCHIHNMGYDLSTSYKVIDYFKPIFKLAKILKFKLLIHLNDSLDPIGSYKDRHAHIGKTIWKDSDGYRTLIQMCEYNNTPYILEIPNKDYMKGIDLNLSKII